MTVSFRPPIPENLDADALRDDDSGAFISYRRLGELADRWAERLHRQRSLIFLFIPNGIDGVAALLGGWQAGHAVALLDPKMSDEARRQLSAIYRPDFTLCAGSDGQLDVHEAAPGAGALHADLALLLSTSGSTGSPKFVRLSQGNVQSNALAIATCLAMRDDDVGCGHLPLHYSYGLSVLTSHLWRGASVLLTEKSFTDREFWPLAREARITQLPGVPFHFSIMQRLRFERLNLPDLRVLTQAGGALNVESRQLAHAFMESQGGKFHVMYGQTEAAPRITTLAHEDFPSAPDSVGTALPGGTLQVVDDVGQSLATGQDGLVLYSGSNVMLGYAECRDDLALGDEMHGVLATGDIGHLDNGGRLTITGRAKRFGKIFGLRVNLDEIEQFLGNSEQRIAVVQKDDLVHIFGCEAGILPDLLLQKLMDRYTIPRSAYRLHALDELPVTARGKVDYRALEDRL